MPKKITKVIKSNATHSTGGVKKFKWIVEFVVHERWVEDGFNIDQQRAKDMIENALPYSHGFETKAKILASPPRKEILKTQGY